MRNRTRSRIAQWLTLMPFMVFALQLMLLQLFGGPDAGAWMDTVMPATGWLLVPAGLLVGVASLLLARSLPRSLRVALLLLYMPTALLSLFASGH